MKYIKIFELFDTKSANFRLRKNDNKINDYIFTIDNDEFWCSFDLLLNNCWVRSYGRMYHNVNDEIGKNAYKIVSTVSDITIDFLNRIKPNYIQIEHIYMNNESMSTIGLNKRAKINYQFLKNIIPMDYDISYYKKESFVQCVISKKNYIFTKILFDEKKKIHI